MSSLAVAVGDDGAMASTLKHHGVQLRLQGIGKRYGDSQVLDGIDLDIAPGELVALLGPSGSGKTTLLRVVAGLLHADSGRVLFDDTDATDLSLRERNVGFVFQHYALFKHMTVAQNVAFGLSSRPRRTRPARKVIDARVAELLRLVQLPDLGGRYPEQLSGGQKQRVALARALAVDPNILLLDEPFGALDAKVRVELRRWLRGLHEQTGQTTLFVTHDQDEALELADRVVLLRDGRIEQVGTPAQLYDTPASAYVFGFIGRAAVVDGVVADGRFNLAEAAWSVPAVDIADGPAQLYVRPHDVFPAAGDAAGLPVGDDGTLAAQVLAVHRLADRVTVHVQVAGQPRILELDVPAGDACALPAIGSTLSLALRSFRIYPT